MSKGTVRVAAIQATPVILDADASVTKAIRLLGEAAGDGVRLAVFPETFVSLYPSGAWAYKAARFDGFDEMWQRLWDSSVDVPGPQIDKLIAACAEHESTASWASTRESRPARESLQHGCVVGPRACCGDRK